VPEIASRSHLENMPAMIERSLNEACIDWNQINAVAATYGPGLASSLLVGGYNRPRPGLTAWNSIYCHKPS